MINENTSKYEDSPYKMENAVPLGEITIADVLSLIEPNENVTGVLFEMKGAYKPLRNELGKFFGHLLYDDERSISFCKNLITCIHQAEYNSIVFFERILLNILMLNDTFRKERVTILINLSHKIVDSCRKEYAFMSLFCGMITKFAKKDPYFRSHFYGDKLVDKIYKWLANNGTPSLNNIRRDQTLFKSNKFNHKHSYEIVTREENLIKDYTDKVTKELVSLKKKLEGYVDTEPDSEDDLYETEIEVGSHVDYITEATYDWTSGTVNLSMGEIFRVQKGQDEMEVDGASLSIQEQWINKDEAGLAPHQTKAQSVKSLLVSLYNKAYNS